MLGLFILLAAEGHDELLLPIVLGSAGTLLKCLDRATKETDIPNARKTKLYCKLHLHRVVGHMKVKRKVANSNRVRGSFSISTGGSVRALTDLT
jgi:hypothetical protein